MPRKNWMFSALAVLLVAAAMPGTSQQSATPSGKNIPATYVPLLEARKALQTGKSTSIRQKTIRAASSTAMTEVKAESDDSRRLPLWTFDAFSARDGHHHLGAMVGTDPFNHPGTSKIPAQIIPLILKMHSVAVSLNTTTGVMTTAPGKVTFDPTRANNIPATLLGQSPIFNAAPFSFGPTFVGNTQYIDAFQRGNFYQALGENLASYHLLLDPVNTLRGVEIDLAPALGVAVTDPNFFGPPAFCAPMGIVDFYWLDFYLNDRVLPGLRDRGVNPGTLPIFMIYNTFEGAPANNIFTCCVLGYHSYGGFPTPTQTYSLVDFDTTGALGAAFENTVVAAHEVGEWANDPFTINLVAPWGGTGQVSGSRATWRSVTP